MAHCETYRRCHVFLEGTELEKSRISPKKLSGMVDLDTQSRDYPLSGFAARTIVSTVGDQDLLSKDFS
jgi:hypothetical protein